MLLDTLDGIAHWILRIWPITHQMHPAPWSPGLHGRHPRRRPPAAEARDTGRAPDHRLFVPTTGRVERRRPERRDWQAPDREPVRATGRFM